MVSDSLATFRMLKRRYPSLRGQRYSSVKRQRIMPVMNLPFRAPRQRRTNARTAGYLGIERKFFDTGLANANLTAPTGATGGEHNPSATVCLNAVAQSDGESDRDGRRMTMDSIQINGTIALPPGTNNTVLLKHPNVFVALVLDKQCNGALLNSEDVFKNPGSVADTATVPYRNLQYIDRFTILKSKVIRLDQQVVAYDGTNMEYSGAHTSFKMYVNLKGMKTTFKDTSGVIANITDNSLNLVAFTSSADLSPELSYGARLRFRG